MEREAPTPDGDEVAVAVGATAVNRADVMQRQGRYPPPDGATDVLGLELAGRVAELGGEVHGWAVGEHVMAVVAGGGYAERCVVPASSLLRVPEGLSDTEAAAIPEVYTTVYDNVMVRGGLVEGETLLVHGGSSGIGTAAILLARRAGARVIVTASSASKLQVAHELGADVGIDYTGEDFVERTREVTDGRGADVILDVVGGPYLARNLAALALDGRLVVIGLQGGATAELSLATMLQRRLTVTASTLRARSVEAKARVAEGMRRDVLPGFGDGSLRPVVDRVLDLGDAAEAHRLMEEGEHRGKIVLRVV